MCCASVNHCGISDALYCSFNWPVVDSIKMKCPNTHLFLVHPVHVRCIFCLQSAAETGAV